MKNVDQQGIRPADPQIGGRRAEKAMFTQSIGVNTFKGQYINFWNYIMAASIIMNVLALIIYIMFNRIS